MAFRFIKSAGQITEPVTILMYASGVIHPGGVVEIPQVGTNSVSAQGFVGPAQVGAVGTGSPATAIFGVSLDYVQGNSDTVIRVIPFVAGQIWEADCVSAASTLQVGKRHQLYSDILLNNTSYDNTSVVGVFRVFNISSATTGSGKVIGEFIRVPIMQQTASVIAS